MIIVGVYVDYKNILQNFCGKVDIAMNGEKPLLHPYEKAVVFMQMMFETTFLPSDVVMECMASTG